MAEKTYKIRAPIDSQRIGLIGPAFWALILLPLVLTDGGVLSATVFLVTIPVFIGFVVWLFQWARKGSGVRAVRLTDDELHLERVARRPVPPFSLDDLRLVELKMEAANSATIRIVFTNRCLEIESNDSGTLWALRKHLENEIQARRASSPASPVSAPPVNPGPGLRLRRRTHVRPRLRSTLGEAPEESQEASQEDVSTHEESREDHNKPEPPPALELKPEAVSEEPPPVEEADETDDEEQRWRSI